MGLNVAVSSAFYLGRMSTTVVYFRRSRKGCRVEFTRFNDEDTTYVYLRNKDKTEERALFAGSVFDDAQLMCEIAEGAIKQGTCVAS